MSEMIDPWKRERAAPLTEEVPLPELGVTVTLRALGVLETTSAMGEATHILAQYVQGDRPALFPGPDGVEYPLNELLVKDLCLLQAMHVTDQPLGFTWWLGLALHCEAEYTQLSDVATQLNAKKQAAYLGNSTKAAPTTR